MKVGYVRVSTLEQNTARQDECLNKLGVEKIYTDRLTGKNTARPQLHAMLDFVREGDVVIVESYSRLARSTMDLLKIVDDLHQKGVAFQSIKENFDTSTANGKLMLTIYAGLAQFERENMLERQREGIEIARAEGKYTGRPMSEIIGFDDYYDLWKKGEITATRLCKDLKISRSTFYRRKSMREDDEVIDF